MAPERRGAHRRRRKRGRARKPDAQGRPPPLPGNRPGSCGRHLFRRRRHLRAGPRWRKAAMRGRGSRTDPRGRDPRARGTCRCRERPRRGLAAGGAAGGACGRPTWGPPWDSGGAASAGVRGIKCPFPLRPTGKVSRPRSVQSGVWWGRLSGSAAGVAGLWPRREGGPWRRGTGRALSEE